MYSPRLPFFCEAKEFGFPSVEAVCPDCHKMNIINPNKVVHKPETIRSKCSLHSSSRTGVSWHEFFLCAPTLQLPFAV